METVEFNSILDKLAKSKTMIPTDAIISILGGMVGSANPESESVKGFVKALKDEPDEGKISKMVLFTCNAFVINLWKAFGPQIEKILAEDKKSEEAKA